MCVKRGNFAKEMRPPPIKIYTRLQATALKIPSTKSPEKYCHYIFFIISKKKEEERTKKEGWKQAYLLIFFFLKNMKKIDETLN